MQQLPAPALPLDRLNTMRTDLARLDNARIDNATLQALFAHVSAPATPFNGPHALPTHSTANAVPAALQPPAPAQNIAIKLEEPPVPAPLQPRDAFPPHFPEKPRHQPSVDQGNAGPSSAAPQSPITVAIPTKPRSQAPRRRRRDMSGFAAQFVVGPSVSRKGMRVARPPATGTPAAEPGLDDTQPSMDEKEVAQLLLELNPVRNGAAPLPAVQWQWRAHRRSEREHHSRLPYPMPA